MEISERQDELREAWKSLGGQPIRTSVEAWLYCLWCLCGRHVAQVGWQILSCSPDLLGRLDDKARHLG